MTIERNGEPVAVLAPSGLIKGITLREVANRLGNVPPPDDGFADDLEAVQASQPRTEAPTWHS
ncbi:MAG: hypothetical protein M1343_03590 [Chloroflexi bacterium]|nr:hypothetical protein [Chloroflexota bacterium]